MEENLPNILSDSLGSRHLDLNQKADLTLKGMHIPHGDLLLVHLMMLHEVRTQEVFEMGRFAWGTYLWRYTSWMMREMFKKIVEFRQFKEANPESKNIHKYTVLGFMLPFKIWILETFPEATKFYVRIPTELPMMRCWRSKSALSWENCCRIINVSVPNNQPIQVVANETELMLPFYVRYVNWTLNHEESPPPQQSPPPQHSPVRNSPPAVQSPPRRSMYKSDTCSTESATNASSSQQPEIETRLLKKKKSSTKALVKCLLGIVAELSSKVDRVLEEKRSAKQTDCRG
ncbi:unnamed protein product [Lactuca saligna]|uniref:Uncharacterized protein n=1 Tax=Lactuca saligna TaxID=75948 RepID=A0AA35V451_LACSI|nr:unnamed protein product [Lactuca saligna]